MDEGKSVLTILRVGNLLALISCCGICNNSVSNWDHCVSFIIKRFKTKRTNINMIIVQLSYKQPSQNQSEEKGVPKKSFYILI